MRNQGIERNTRLNVEVAGNDKLERCLVCTVELELMRTVIRKTSIHTVQKADQIEQRSDVRIRLAIVITEKAFVVTDQARVNIRDLISKVISKSFVERELKSAIITPCTAEAANRRIAASQILGVATYTARSRRKRLTRVEQEVMITIIERTVLNN